MFDMQTERTTGAAPEERTNQAAHRIQLAPYRGALIQKDMLHRPGQDRGRCNCFKQSVFERVSLECYSPPQRPQDQRRPPVNNQIEFNQIDSNRLEANGEPVGSAVVCE